MNCTPHEYQKTGIEFLTRRLLSGDKPAGAGLLADPGLGKTLMTLSTLELMTALGETRGALIVAPLRVCRTVWPAEVEKWGADLSVAQMTGTAAQKKRALFSDADLYVTNPETLPWLKKQLDENVNLDPFDTLVLDESTKFKTWSAKRTKSLRSLLPRFHKRVILTGTPAPNHLGDIFSQIYTLDNGERLGKTIGWFRREFMWQGGYQGRQWLFREGREERLNDRISDIVLRMDAKHHLDLPPITYNPIPVELPPDIMRVYKDLEQKLFVLLASGEDITASNAGAKYVMCRGVANGGVYDEEKRPQHVHDAKVHALAELIDELNGKHVLVAYSFHHDLERLKRKWPKAPVIRGGTPNAEVDQIIEDWNARKIPVLFCQPQAMAHGLNLQTGGNDVVWFGLTDSLETYQQLNCRLYRQGNDGEPVRIHHLLAKDTVDAIIYERITGKAERQQSLLDALNEYRKSF